MSHEMKCLLGNEMSSNEMSSYLTFSQRMCVLFLEENAARRKWKYDKKNKSLINSLCNLPVVPAIIWRQPLMPAIAGMFQNNELEYFQFIKSVIGKFTYRGKQTTNRGLLHTGKRTSRLFLYLLRYAGYERIVRAEESEGARRPGQENGFESAIATGLGS